MRTWHLGLFFLKQASHLLVIGVIVLVVATF